MGYVRANAQHSSAGRPGRCLDMAWPISGIVSTDKNRVRAQPKNGYVLSKFPVLTAHDQPGQPPVLRAKTGPTRAPQAACVLCFCVRCFFYSPPPPSPVRLTPGLHGSQVTPRYLAQVPAGVPESGNPQVPFGRWLPRGYLDFGVAFRYPETTRKQ